MTKSLALEHAHTLSRIRPHLDAEREELRRFQVRKLRFLLAHCRSNVAFYRERWAGSALQPADVAAPEDLAALPLIDKNDLRTHPLAERLADAVEVRRLVKHVTSGSSGEPFALFRSQREEHLLNLFRVRAWRELGIGLHDRMARLTELPLGEGRRSRLGRWRETLGIYRQENLNAYGPPDETLDRLWSLRPDVVCGYPSALAHLAGRMEEREPRQLGLRLVLTGGEVLRATTRRVIEHAFAAPLFDFYGAHEFNLLAWQCRHGGTFHICDDNVIVEVIGRDGRAVAAGEIGEVVATALHSYTMPFVRYRTGDLAVRDVNQCSCGQAFSTLRSIEGRRSEYLRLPGGRRVHPWQITGPLVDGEVAWIHQYQIVQASERRVVLNILPGRAPRREDLERLRAFGAAILGSDVCFEVALVEQFAQHSSGKLRSVVSIFDEPDQNDLDQVGASLSGDPWRPRKAQP